jgi:pimeloyl-ACP methyl ester carboxylesterase
MTAEAFYLGADAEPFFAQVHEGRGDGTPILLCPPLGWDDVASYRVRRTWAEQLAEHGHTTLRLDLPGTGDSPGSPDDPGRVEAWTAAIAEAARWLHDRGGPPAAIGIGGGGLLVWLAAAAGAPIRELILWGVPSRGASFVRELRAFARLEAIQLAGGSRADGEVAPGGFRFSAETLAELEAVDLAARPLPPSPGRRALLLERDGLPVDDALVRAAGDGAKVQAAEGYGEMLAEPGVARPPQAVFDAVADWLADEEVSERDGHPRPGRSETRVEGARERPFELEHEGATLTGIVTELDDAAEGGLCAVFLNSGAIRRIGPGRLYVTLARRWAARGVPSLRLDLAGIGDSDGDAARFVDVAEFYEPEFAGQISAALDALGNRRFLLVGLCSGGYWSFRAALGDERVAAVAAVNPGALVWSRLLIHDRRLQPLRSSLTRVRSAAEASRLARVVAARLRERVGRALGGDRLDRALDRLRERRTRVLLLFSEAEPQLWELERDGHLARRSRWPNLEIERIAGRDHTLRPAAMQAEALRALDRFVDDLL